MTEALGLRERKKLQTRREIFFAAIQLVSANGYDNVTVAEIAEAAGVSKMTVFNYYGSKEDLLMSAPDQHVDDCAEAVRDRAPGRTPVDAVRDYFLTALAEYDPVSGLSDNDIVRSLQGIISRTPALRTRYGDYAFRAQERLAEQLAREDGCDELDAGLIAAQIEGVRMSLVRGNIARMVAGETAEAVYPRARANAERAFALLDSGLGGLLRR